MQEFVEYFQENNYKIDTEDIYQTNDQIKQYVKDNPVTNAKISAIRDFLKHIGRLVSSRDEDKIESLLDRVKYSKLTGRDNTANLDQSEVQDKILDDEELEAVYKAATLRQECIIKSMLDSGCRPGEVAAWSKEDINFDDNDVGATVHINKTYVQSEGVQNIPKTHDSNRTIELTQETADKLRQFIEEEGVEDRELLFKSYRTVYRVIKEAFRHALVRVDDGKTEVTPHWLRHNAATRLIDEGHSKEEVQKYLGHHSVKVTEIYEHISGSEKIGIHS